MKASYLGLGVIGSGMCGNLLAKGVGLTVWNRTRGKAEPFLEKGAHGASTPAEAGAASPIVCLCVSDTPDVESVVFGADGALAGMREGSLLIDFSTISAEATEEFARRAAGRGIAWVDAPVSGGDVGARNGTLTIMAGGDVGAFGRALPLMEKVGRSITHMGPPGSGQRTKMVNQIAVAATIASMAEALNFAREQGMDVEKVLEVISSGAAGSWSLSNYGPRLLRGDYAPGFSAALMAKDLRLVLSALEGLQADYTVVRHMSAVYERMVAEGMEHLGNHAAALPLGWKGGGPSGG